MTKGKERDNKYYETDLKNAWNVQPKKSPKRQRSLIVKMTKENINKNDLKHKKNTIRILRNAKF